MPPHLALAEDDGGNALGLSDLRRICSLSAFERPKSWVILENAEAFRPGHRLSSLRRSREPLRILLAMKASVCAGLSSIRLWNIRIMSLRPWLFHPWVLPVS